MVILGLGSNIGDRLAYLAAAVRRLRALLPDMRLSRIVESQAVLPEGAPSEWNLPYLNMAVSGTAQLAPEALLAEAKTIERELGRAFRGVWSPREIDIDILAMDDLVLEVPGLSIPHPKLTERDFVLLPLADVAPQWHYPSGVYAGKTASEIIAAKAYALGPQLRDTGLEIHD